MDDRSTLTAGPMTTGARASTPVERSAVASGNDFGVQKQTNKPGDSSALPSVAARHPKEPVGRGASMGSPSLNELSTDYCQSG